MTTHTPLLNEIDQVYRCMRSLDITSELIAHTDLHIKNTMLLWKDLNLLVTLSSHLFKDQIVNETKILDCGLSDKNEDYI